MSVVATSPPPKILLTVHEVAGMLSVGERTVWRWAASGVIPRPVKQGRKLARWFLKDIQDYLNNLQRR